MSIEYPESYLCDILNEVRTIAVVGASSKKHRDSYKVMQSLIENGYKVFPINPNESGKNILNLECFPSLDAVKENIDMVDIFRANDAVMDIAKDAISAGLRVVMDRCPKKELIK
ncbi:MAG: CoA-binding protein [Proteobacteria bacterium]|nr:CoA-binding protein [Pseudomonadota bacterium]